jgi:phenylacetate-CoA ligase
MNDTALSRTGPSEVSLTQWTMRRIAAACWDGWQTYRLIKRGLASSYWTADRVRRAQEQGLRDLLVHAYAHVPLYRTLYDDAGFRPEMFRSLDDLSTIPPLTKDRLKLAAPENLLSDGIDADDCTSVHTSGSTGSPLRIVLSAADRRWQRAAAWRILFEHGFRWTDRTTEIRATFGESFFVQRLGLAPKDWISIWEPPELWARHVAETRPDVIVAGAGTLHALAEAVERLRATIHPPRLIISDSETLSPGTKQFVRGILGSVPVDVYGLVELSNFAWECERGTGFHVSADSHIVEVSAPPGRPGPLIATALGMRTMPIIRYETGDLAEQTPNPCPCGRQLPVLSSIVGRAVDSVTLPDGQRLFWPFFHERLARHTELRQWRVIQEALRLVRLEIVAPGKDNGLIERVRADLAEALPASVTLAVESVDTLQVPAGGKTRMVISRLAADPSSIEGHSS